MKVNKKSVSFRCTPGELEKYKRDAEDEGISLTQYICNALNKDHVNTNGLSDSFVRRFRKKYGHLHEKGKNGRPSVFTILSGYVFFNRDEDPDMYNMQLSKDELVKLINFLSMCMTGIAETE